MISKEPKLTFERRGHVKSMILDIWSQWLWSCCWHPWWHTFSAATAQSWANIRQSQEVNLAVRGCGRAPKTAQGSSQRDKQNWRTPHTQTAERKGTKFTQRLQQNEITDYQNVHSKWEKFASSWCVPQKTPYMYVTSATRKVTTTHTVSLSRSLQSLVMASLIQHFWTH